MGRWGMLKTDILNICKGSVGSMGLRQVLELFGLKAKEEKKNTSFGHEQNRTALLSSSEAEKRLEHIIANSVLVNAGQVHLLGLEEVKRGLGGKWSALRERVLGTLDKIVARHIGVNDVFFSRSEEEHIIVFSNRSQKVALLICAKILKELTDKYLGSADMNKIFVKTAVGRVKGNLLFEKTSINDIFEEVLPAPESLKEQKSKKQSKKVFVGGKRPYEVVYKPLWDARNEVISTYMVNAQYTDSLGGVRRGYDVLQDPDDVESVVGLDKEVLAETIDMMNDLFLNNFRAIFSIPICYETLFNWDRLKDFLSHLQIIPPDLYKYISFVLIDFPTGVPEVKMRPIVSNLLHYAGAVTMTSRKIPRTTLYYRNCGIQVVSMSIPKRHRSPKRFWNNIAKFANKCSIKQLHISLEDVNTVDDLLLAKESGVRFLSGEAIAPYSDTPGHMSRTTLKDLIAK